MVKKLGHQKKNKNNNNKNTFEGVRLLFLGKNEKKCFFVKN
jgi:hypothetical protein